MPRNEILRQHRIRHNWRQQDIADQLGISIITVQRWERGTQHPSAYYRIKLCTLFGIGAQELGLVEDSLSPVAPESRILEDRPVPVVLDSSGLGDIALWTVPYRRNPHFTGRDELLTQLAEQLAPGEPDQAVVIRQAALTQALAVKGLGGIGKTQTAIEYAYRAREQRRYVHTLWINAASEEAILTSFVALANQLPDLRSLSRTDQHKIVAATIRWLEQCEQPWLLIADNADDLSQIHPYLPHQGNGRILLTTRAGAVGSLASSIEVDTMGVIEGTHLLLRRAHRLANASDEEIDEASNIVVALAQFPLALDQAGAYIEETGCSLKEYLQIFQQHRQALLARRGGQATPYPESVATTWSLSFQRVEQTNPAASELLRLCAFVSPDHIPEELFTEGASYWPPVLQQAVTDRFAFNEMLETLLSFSLVKRLSEERLLSIHRLIQVVQMDRLPPEEQRRWSERLVRAITTVFPYDPKGSMVAWSQSLRSLEQAQAGDALIQQYQLEIPEAADMLDRVGSFLHERALYTLAEPLYRRALHIWEQQKGPERFQMTTSLTGLVNIYREQGKYEEAEQLCLRALHIREQQMGPDHRETAASWHNLGLIRYKRGKYAEAEVAFQRSLVIAERRFGAEHYKTAYPLTGLAFLHQEQRQYEKAEMFYQRVLRIREQQMGVEHSEVAYPLVGLANIYREQGRYEEAEPFYQRALRIREQQFGGEHPTVAASLSNLADLYRERGRYEEAWSLYQRALRIWEQQVGTEHPDVAYPLMGLANLYREQRRYAEAEALYQRALRIREQQLGREHPETAIVFYDFARAQQMQGKDMEAEALYQRALAVRENALGSSHPVTIATRLALSAIQLDPPGERLGGTKEIFPPPAAQQSGGSSSLT
jgi:tetratricopeptide (TPR) repeat protein/transcriptional regulator with XRE-family HTH domain